MASSGLSFIHVKSSNPFELFKCWRNEASSCKIPSNIMCLATSTKEGVVSNRNVLLQDLTDGFIFVTDSRSRKIKAITENPDVAGTFLWNYRNTDNILISRQVRVEGSAVKVNSEFCREFFKKEPLVFQIRAHICHQDQPVDWKELEKKYNDLLKDVTENKKELTPPDHLVAYKIVPRSMEFYYATENCIADRVLFTKTNDIEWKFVHLEA